MNAGRSQPLLRSGVAPIDERLGGLTPGKPHLLTGPPGSGKTAVCLGFLGTALSEGQSAAILTQDDSRDLLAEASDLGLDLRRAAATGRFAMVCYKRNFAAQLDRALSAEPLVEELVRLMGPGAPDCLVVDSVTPFLDTGSASGPGTTALASAIERLRATTIVTYPGDVRDYYDRRLDPLVRRCAAVLHLSSYGEGIGRMDVVKARARLWSDSPTFFSVLPGRGVVALDDGGPGGDSSTSERFRRQLLVFPGPDGFPDDLLAALGRTFSVSLHANRAITAPEGLPPDVGAVVVAARWDAFNDAAMFLRQLRRFGNRTPVVLVTRGDVRSSDRARAYLNGFDEVVADAVGPAELIARLTAVLRRGRSTAVPTAVPEDVAWATLSGDGSAALLDEAQFRVAVETAAGRDDGQPFSVVLLDPGEADLGALAALVARIMRAASGDLAGVVGERVAVYLPGTRRMDATPFVRRVCSEWRRARRPELRVAQLAYPDDHQRLRADLRIPALTVQTSLAE
jgi:KaiC/GvpD/RAD55 family RecA-like ATPase/CheY-like chemotaxis protein